MREEQHRGKSARSGLKRQQAYEPLDHRFCICTIRNCFSSCKSGIGQLVCPRGTGTLVASAVHRLTINCSSSAEVDCVSVRSRWLRL